jgi:methionine-R-sulfoxide reductase
MSASQPKGRSSASLLSHLLLACTGLVCARAEPTMKDSSASENAKAPQVACSTGEKSACGLPSKAVIDLSKTKVQRSDAEWRSRLSPEQYQVSRRQGTEPPFRNAFWNNHEDGMYVCVGCDTPLFDSQHKFESGTGWPSFYQPVEKLFVAETEDTSHFMIRVEVHCQVCGGHLGHLFEDGPKPTGQRYCINSASLNFIKRSDYASWLAQHQAGQASSAPR